MLLDTDALIDLALDRHPFSGPASMLLDRIEHGSANAFIAELIRFVEVASTGTDSLRYAASLPMTDFKDAMQVAAARACGARHIVTRNLRDYRHSPIPAISPEAALEQLQ